MDKTTEYALMKKCANCGHNNPKGRASCSECNLLFIGEITFKELAMKFETKNEKERIE